MFVRNGSNKTGIIIHGWRDCAIDFLYLARLYERELGGYNVVMPDLHAHGLSEGDMIRMGWLDRKDILHWISLFQTDTMVVHGVSMGGATTMMTSRINEILLCHGFKKRCRSVNERHLFVFSVCIFI